MDDQVDGLAVILHIQPVPHVLSLAVHRQGLVVQGVGDHQGDQLLREVVGTVVVAAAAYRAGEAEGPVIRHDQQVRAGFAGGVGGGGVDRGLFGEEQVRPVQRQIAVDFIRRYLMVPLDAVFPASVHHGRRADDVRLQEDARILNAAVHVAFRSEVHHDVRMLFLKELIHGFPVTDIRLHKTEVRIVHDALQRAQVACVGQLIQADDPVIRILAQHVKDEIASDESGAAGYDDRHNFTSDIHNHI